MWHLRQWRQHCRAAGVQRAGESIIGILLLQVGRRGTWDGQISVHGLLNRDILLSKDWLLTFQRGMWYPPSLAFNPLKVKVKCSRYRPGVAQRVGRGTALLFHDRGTRRGWVVGRTARPHFTPGEDPVPIVQEAGWAPGPVWKSRPHRDSIPQI